MVDLDDDFCFPCSSCLAKFDSLRELRKHICGILHDNANDIKNYQAPTKTLKTEYLKKEIDSQASSFLQKSNAEINKSEQDKFPNIVQTDNLEMVSELYQKTSSKSNVDLVLQDNVSDCAASKQMFSSQITYLRHQWAHKKNKGSVCLPCSEHDCSEFFWKTETLDSHKAKAHGIHKTFSCNICTWSSKFKQLAKKHHENKHLNLNLNSYICTECGEGFKSQQVLKHHMKKELGIYDYKCKQCEYKTITNVQLEIHIVNKHTKAFRFICSECGKGFAERFFLKFHMSRHTGERNYKCKFCENRFRLKEVLKRHENIHLNIKPYECNMCPKKFGGQNNLQVHIKRHLNQKDYLCPRCEKGFIEPAGLRNHRCPKK